MVQVLSAREHLHTTDLRPSQMKASACRTSIQYKIGERCMVLIADDPQLRTLLPHLSR
jgi:hypothetical protein